MPPRVASILHLGVCLLAHRAGATLHHHAVLNARRFNHRRVSVALQRHHLAAPEAAIRRHQHATLRIVDPIAQRFRTEAAEHHVVNGADA